MDELTRNLIKVAHEGITLLQKANIERIEKAVKKFIQDTGNVMEGYTLKKPMKLSGNQEVIKLILMKDKATVVTNDDRYMYLLNSEYTFLMKLYYHILTYELL